MNKIEKLIQELCPEGVNIRLLGDLEDSGVLKLGRGNVISKSDLASTPGDFPVYSSSAAGEGEFGRYGKFMFEDERITWSVDGGGRFFYRPPHKYSVTNVSGWLKVLDPKALSTKYLAHVLFHLWSTKTYNYIVKAHPSVIRQDYSIPVPPIQVQQEIVSILDKFTALEAELGAELEARGRQSEHLRSELVSAFSGSGVETVKFGEVASIVRGASPRPIQSHLTTEDNGVSWIKIGDVDPSEKYITKTAQMIKPDSVKLSRQVKPGDFVLSNSMSFGRPYISKINGCIHDGWLAISDFQERLDSDYLYHLLRSDFIQDELRKRASNGTVSNLNAEIVKALELPLPPLEKQTELAARLDSFEALIGSKSQGLPGEIQARRKQYEYYRNKLLTFKELDAA